MAQINTLAANISQLNIQRAASPQANPAAEANLRSDLISFRPWWTLT